MVESNNIEERLARIEHMVEVLQRERAAAKVITAKLLLDVEKDGGAVRAGAPFVANARVVVVVDGEARGPKIRVFKKKRRKGMRRTKGHRSFLTTVRVKDILL